MKNKLLDLFKGFLIGLDATIPGFSIGTLAVFLNIYERLINDISDLVKHPIRVIKDDWLLGVGFIVGLVLNIVAITYLLSHFPLQTVSLFVGLVIMSIPQTFKKIGLSNVKVPEIIIFLISVGILVGVTLLNAGSVKQIELKPLFMIMLFVMGIVAAGTMIIPGVSGNLIIMAFGYYEAVIETLGGIVPAIANGDKDSILKYAVSLLIFAIGCIIGLILVSKAIKGLLSKFPIKVYSSILGLLVASPFAIYYLTIKGYTINFSSPWLYVTSILTLLIGIFIGLLTSGVLKKKNNEDVKTE